MSIVMEINPFEFFTDSHGDALDAGYIYVGEANKDPRQYPVSAFFDEALTIPAPMPLRTSNGYIVRNGSPAFLYINGNYSILVQDKNRRQIYYVPDFLLTGSSSAVSTADLANPTDPTKGAHMVGAQVNDVDSVPQTVADRLIITSESFGATPVLPSPAIIIPSTDGLQGHINWAWRQATRSLLHNGGISHGRVVIDLRGKEYYINAPLSFPGSGGAVIFRNGFITASDDFPLGEYLIRNNPIATTDQVYFENMYFNGNNRAALVRLDTFIRCRFVGCTFTGNLTYGLYLGTIGFETITTGCYFHQSYNGTVASIPSGSVGIFIENGCTDNHFTDTIIRGNEIGIDSLAQANTYKSVHVYGPDHRLRAEFWAMRLRNNTANNRLNDCQFDDGCRVLLENPSRLQMKGSSFASLSGAPVDCIVLKAITPGHFMTACQITGSMFNVPAGSDAIKIAADSLGFTQSEFKNNVIADNEGTNGVIVRTTRIKVKATASKVSSGSIDISNKFILGVVSNAQKAAHPTVKVQRVSSVTITNGGTGYLSPPAVTFSAADGGVVATGTAVLTGTAVTSVTITDPGRYFVPATVSFAGGSGSGAAGSVVMVTDAHMEPVQVVWDNAFSVNTISWATDKILLGEVHFSIDTSIDTN
jgi:hypothetical protein